MSAVKTIVEAAAAIRSGEVTPLQLVQQCLDEVRRYEPAVHAWVLVDDEGARSTADALTKELRAGRDRGPLHGIPIGVKDIIDVAGLPTRAGSSLTAAEPVQQDAEVVRRLREAGAIILGKTVTTEFACFDPSPTRNPWNLAHTPGGSSSGSAAAVASGMCFAAVGTQTGGSIIRPAAYCGVCGLKPAFGEMDRDGVIPVSAHLDHVGPIARSVADLEILYRAMTGGEALATTPRKQLKIGWLKDQFWNAAHAQTQQLMSGAIDRLGSSSIEIPQVGLPFSFAEVTAYHRTIMAVEAAAYHRSQFKQHQSQYGRNISRLIEEGFSTSEATYESARAHQKRLIAESKSWFNDVEGWIMPATPAGAPPDLSTTGDPRFNSPWSYVGLPALTIPYGLTAEGMPVGMQIVGGSTGRILATGRQIELALGFRAQPALLHGSD